MRHSDIRLTMATYTEARLLNVSEALDSLPKLTPDKNTGNEQESMRATGTDGTGVSEFPPNAGDRGKTVSFPDMLAGNFGAKSSGGAGRENCTKPTKKSLECLLQTDPRVMRVYRSRFRAKETFDDEDAIRRSR